MSSPRSSQKLTSQHTENATLPLILGAHSKQGVQRYAQALKLHLGARGKNWKMGDVALPLERRRSKQRFFWTNTFPSIENLRHSLDLSEDDIAETPKGSKKVVLAFPGQSRRIIGCDRSFFDSCYVFRSIVLQCDSEIVRLGFPSNLPSMFDSDPVSDVIVLQSGTFA